MAIVVNLDLLLVKRKMKLTELAARVDIIVTGCGASFGGGVFGGVLYNSAVYDNQARTGGGVCSGVLVHCTVMDNLAYQSGGGTYGGFATNCIVYHNISRTYSNWDGTAFAFSDDISLPALEDAAKATRAIAQSGQSGRARAHGRIAVARRGAGRDLYRPADPLASLADADKVRLLERLEGRTRARSTREWCR